jgi:2'-5' RNA ligase
VVGSSITVLPASRWAVLHRPVSREDREVPRRRFAVALVVPAPVSFEIDGLRRALGDRQLGRIDPHITLVPPINLHEEQVADALAVVQEAASQAGPMTLAIGPLETFSASSPVRFLAVDPWQPVVDLRRRCTAGVLDRPEKRPFHPHVTVDIAGGTTEGMDPAVELLRHYRAEVLIDRVTVLEHVQDLEHRRWETYLSYRFG